MTAKGTVLLVGSALVALVVGSAACSGGGSDGACSVEHGTFIGPDTGYIWDPSDDYCADQSGCQAFCNAVSAREDYRNCHYTSGSWCSGSLPTPPDPSICAISLTTTCGGSPSTDTNCFNCDTVTPGKSDYDPGTDCLSQWGSKVGRGATCNDAMTDLASQ
jgi:hypothetical protein